MTFAASIVSESDKQRVERLEYKGSKNGNNLIAVSVTAEGGNKSKEYKVTATGYDLTRTQGRAWPIPPPVKFYGFPDEVSAYYQNAGFTSDFALELERQLKRVFYLGPLREVPRRSYIWSGDVPEHVGQNGDGAVSAILAASERRMSGGFKKPSRPFQLVIADWLKRLGLLDAFAAKKIAQNRKDYEVRVRTAGSSKDVDLTDVGFGISQVLPVVVESFYVSSNSTVIVEQPELHLHPRVQSELADLFIAAIRAREQGSDRTVQFILESHSEHFLQRLQTRVAEGVLKPDEVALYFCEPSPNGSVLRELRVDLFGEIQDWPQDFFGNPMADLSARLNAAASRDAESAER